MAVESDKSEKETFAKSLPYKVFKQRNPCYDADRWAVLRALYEGADKVDHDCPEGRAMLKRLLPQHPGEENDVYAKRLEFALYIPYAGQIIDFIIAAMSSDPLTVNAEPKTDKWYDDFYKDTSAPGGRKQPFEEFMRCQLLTALICRRAWTLVDLPNVFDEESQAATLAEQEDAGALDAYLVPVEPENVIDWEETDDGLVKWAIVARKIQVREGLGGDRKMVREEFTYYTTEQWARYCIEYDCEKKPNGPEDTDPVEIDGEGDHTFKRCPLVPFDLTPGLHAMGKIKQLAQSHFNKRSALDWGEYRSAFQFLAAYLGDENPMQPATSDPNRAVSQRVGHGRVWVGGEKDKIGYVGPDAAPFDVIMRDLNLLRDEMHRVLHHMALSVDNSAAALQRSGASKAQDSAATVIVLKKLGQLLRDYAEEIMCLVATAHGDGDKKYVFTPQGLAEFEAMSLHDMLEEAATLEEIDIPSAKFQQQRKYKLAKICLGGEVDDEDLVEIKKDLEKNITNESLLPPPNLDTLGLDGGDGTDPLKAAAAKPVKAPKVKPTKAPVVKGAKAAKVPAATAKAS